MQAEWRSASMECGEQCVIVAGMCMMIILVITGIEIMPKLCAGNWGTLTQEVN